MAGSYPDVPGYRFAYDKDGTSVYAWDRNTSTGSYPTAIQLNGANNNNVNKSTFSTGTDVIVLFPEPRNISGMFFNVTRNPQGKLQWSNDTTSGLDGTWTDANGLTVYVGADIFATRSSIDNFSISAATAVRVTNLSTYGGCQIRNMHIYGSIPTTNSPDRLRIVDTSSNDIAAQLDFGNIRQRNNVTKQIKVVNNSSTKTANNITLTLDASYDANPTLIGQFQLSTDNTAFANAINIGTLAPGVYCQ